MLKHHARWPQYVHRVKMWKCDQGVHQEECVQDGADYPSTCTHKSPPYFSSSSHFKRHINTVHKIHIDNQWSHSDLIALADRSEVDSTLDSTVCPICYMSPAGLKPIGSESMENHIANHLQIIMLLSLRLINICSEGEGNTEDATGQGSSGVAVTDASRSSVDGLDEDYDDLVAGLPSSPSGSVTNSPVSAALGEAVANDIITWDEITKQVRKDYPLHESDMDRRLNELEDLDGLSLEDMRKRLQERGLLFDDLEETLRSNAVPYFDKNRIFQGFWPASTLQQVMSRECILYQLMIYKDTEPESRYRMPLTLLADTIRNHYCKVFAVLLLIGKGRFIQTVIDAHVTDASLPLQSKGTKCVLYRKHTETSSDTRLECFEGPNWNTNDRVCISEYQYAVNPCVLRFDDKERTPRHEKFDEKDVIPFTNETENTAGGFGVVTKVTIPENCHEFHGLFQSV
jgi:hypothetical protein